jgi:MFS family permease
MLAVLANRTYRHLFAAQVIALIGTGLATVALGLLAWNIAGEDAGLVLGTALAIKMVAYVTLAPVASAFADRVPRRAMLVALDLIRATVALALPFVSEVWQVYVLIFLLQAASAGFTPTFQATIPDVLPDEADYTRALSLSRLAYDLESLLSPMLAAALLTVVSFPVLFGGTVIGFLASAVLVLSVTLPSPRPAVPARHLGADDARHPHLPRHAPPARAPCAEPRGRGGGAMVIVNTVVLVKARLGLGETEVALALAAFGGGSMVAALILPEAPRPGARPAGDADGGRDPDPRHRPRARSPGSLAALMALWAVLGFGYSVTQTPSGRLLRRSAQPEDRPAIFAAQFALSHACWLLTYPLAGRFGAAGLGLDATFLVMAGLAALGVVLALRLWPAERGRRGGACPSRPPRRPSPSARPRCGPASPRSRHRRSAPPLAETRTRHPLAAGPPRRRSIDSGRWQRRP